MFLYTKTTGLKGTLLTLSWRRPLSYRNQPIDLLCKSVEWFLYDNGLRHERVQKRVKRNISTIFFSSCRASKDGSLSLFTKPFMWNHFRPIFGLELFHVKGFVKSDKLPSFEARQELKNIVKFFRLTVFSTMPPLSQCFSILEIIEMVGNINTKLVAKICCE